MILELLTSIFAYLFILAGIVSLIYIVYSLIGDIIKAFKKWYKGDDWGWTEILEEYGYQRIYG